MYLVDEMFEPLVSKEDCVGLQKYEEAVALLPKDKQQAVQAYCDAIFDSGAYAEQFFYRLGLKDGIRLYKTVKSIIKGIS